MTRVPMTSAGAARLREELEHLKTVARRKVVSAIAEARGRKAEAIQAFQHAVDLDPSHPEARMQLRSATERH